MGFVTPEEAWMREELRPLVLDILTSPSFRARPYWDPDQVLDSYNRYADGRSPYSPELFRIVCAELWLRKMFDTRGVESEAGARQAS